MRNTTIPMLSVSGPYMLAVQPAFRCSSTSDPCLLVVIQADTTTQLKDILG